MKRFFYEMHAHTSESSSCARAQAKAVVERCRSKGYDGVVITDHMNDYKMKRKGLETIEEKAEYFLKGYREAKKYETEDFNVLPGMELCFTDIEGDFLVYGFDEDFMYKYHMDKFKDLEEFRPVADENGLVIFQAHPFRFDMSIQDPKLLDGIEVYNGNSGHHSNNDIAELWAAKFGLARLSGSDYHGDEGTMPIGGALFTRRITTPQMLVKELKHRDYILAQD